MEILKENYRNFMQDREFSHGLFVYENGGLENADAGLDQQAEAPEADANAAETPLTEADFTQHKTEFDTAVNELKTSNPDAHSEHEASYTQEYNRIKEQYTDDKDLIPRGDALKQADAEIDALIATVTAGEAVPEITEPLPSPEAAVAAVEAAAQEGGIEGAKAKVDEILEEAGMKETLLALKGLWDAFQVARDKGDWDTFGEILEDFNAANGDLEQIQNGFNTSNEYYKAWTPAEGTTALQIAATYAKPRGKAADAVLGLEGLNTKKDDPSMRYRIQALAPLGTALATQVEGLESVTNVTAAEGNTFDIDGIKTGGQVVKYRIFTDTDGIIKKQELLKPRNGSEQPSWSNAAALNEQTKDERPEVTPESNQ